jgi:hypothetical protein
VHVPWFIPGNIGRECVPLQVRKMNADDVGWILATFIQSFREASTQSEDLDGKETAQLVTNLVSNGWSVLVAELEGVLMGWVLFQPGSSQYSPVKFGWVFVRKMVRNQGVAKLLIDRAGIDMSRPVVSPFVPNRSKSTCPLRLTIRQRPFLCLLRTEPN